MTKHKTQKQKENKMKNIFIIFIMFSYVFLQESHIDSTKIKNPQLAWKLSTIPGVGQAYNEKWVKAVGFLSAEIYSISKFMEFKDTPNIGKRNTWAWWILGIWITGMLDAYVDAQLSTFPVSYEENNTDLINNEKDVLPDKTDKIQ